MALPISGARGQDIAMEIDESAFGLLNENTPTRLHSNQQANSPDISLASHSLLTLCDWKTEIGLGNDHLPIIIDVHTTSRIDFIGAPKSTFTNIAKADWPFFNEEIEKKLSDCAEPKDVYHGEAILRKAIISASKQHVPSGRRKSIIPQLPDKAQK